MRRTFCKDGLLSCPDCGSANIAVKQNEETTNLFVQCADCGETGAEYPTELQAVRSWNKKNRTLKEQGEDS